jgi:hypothetical protein
MSFLTLVRPCMVNLPAQIHMDNLILKYIIYEFKSVFLGPDLTEAQRLKHKELVKIRDKKNEKMSNEEKDKKIWCIRTMRLYN